MKFSRTQYIFSAVGLALVVAAGAGAYAYIHRDPYAGLVTHMDVQSDEGVVTLAKQRIATAQASLQATKDAGEAIDPNMYNAIASDALLLGDLVLARESLEASIAANPINGTTWSSYGYTLLMMQDYEAAKNAYLRAVELTPMESTYRDAVKLLKQRFPEEKEKVKELYEDSVDTLGQKMFSMLGLGNWYADAGDCDKSDAHFDVAKSLSSSDEIRTQVEEEASAAIKACKALNDGAAETKN